jgi:ParB family chromosome partitioning protein
MAKNSVDAYGASGKCVALYFDPEDLALVQDVESPLYDHRVNLPIDERMVLNIMAFGVLQPVVFAKNAETGEAEVVAGRQRVKNAREANRRLIAQGLEPIKVPAIPRKAGNAGSMASIMVSENEIRSADTPLGRAEKMQRLMERFGKDEDEIATIFGCSKQTIKNTLALLDCTAAVRNAVEAGKINVSHAHKLSRLAPDEQRDKVAELVQAGDGKTGHAKSKAQRAVVSGEAKPKMRTRAEIEARIAELQEETETFSPHTIAALQWVLGEE